MSGQKGYHGVATVSKARIDIHETRDFCGVGDKRHLSVDFEHAGRNIRLHNFYVPAGGDEPDRNINPKFGHKLDFIEEMRAMRALDGSGRSSILVGDLNIAPLEHDVWSHKQLLKIVSHTPIETDGLKAVIAEGGWSDLLREKFPEPQKLYTWWSYRAKDWDAADKGRRLDHIWSSPDLAPHVTTSKSCARRGAGPSHPTTFRSLPASYFSRLRIPANLDSSPKERKSSGRKGRAYAFV